MCVYCVLGRDDLSNPHSRSLPLLDGPLGRQLALTLLPQGLPSPPPSRTWWMRSGQEVNEEDGQANVKQNHHADEDGVGDLGTVERGCLSPRESTPPPSCSLLCPAPGHTISAGRILGNNQTAQGPERGKNVSQSTQWAELGLEPKNTAFPTANSSGATAVSPSEPSFSLWRCSS